MDVKGFFKEKRWKKWKKDQWLVVFLIGVLLLVIAIPTSGSKERRSIKDGVDLETNIQDANNLAFETDTCAYADTLERRLEEILRTIEGVGYVQVMITLKDYGEAVVEKDKETSYQVLEQSDVGSSETIQHAANEVTIYENQTEEAGPFVAKEKMPQVEGVLVVAQGGANSSVVQNISEAIQALFDVEVHKIKIVKMNMQEGSN